MSTPLPSLTLHTYFRSSCSGRLRIALALKNLPYTTHPVNLLSGAQHTPAHLSLNPSGTVPVLTATTTNPTTGTEETLTITQSIAALEYLEELTDTIPLLPPRTEIDKRARIRTLVNILACDVQPVTNLKIQKRVKALGGDNTAWARELMVEGFTAVEAILAGSTTAGTGTAGKYCVGDEVSLADVCLVPAVWAGERVGVEFDKFPCVKRVFGEMEGLEGVKVAHWMRQGDTPVELRG
ncbi:hypothetical protein FQN50_002309 [Emmonsiellopsis sp. PD_5]|nr:hypothetical protein FQN50_002309 [Emmonsiellopsis sp. PD_5]